MDQKKLFKYMIKLYTLFLNTLSYPEGSEL